MGFVEGWYASKLKVVKFQARCLTPGGHKVHDAHDTLDAHQLIGAQEAVISISSNGGSH